MQQCCEVHNVSARQRRVLQVVLWINAGMFVISDRPDRLSPRSTRLALPGVLIENRRAPPSATPNIGGIAMPKQRYCAKTVFDTPYAQGIKANGAGTTLYISGQVPQDGKGQLVGRGDFPAQARQVFKNIKAMVQAGGGTLADVVKMTTYLTDVRYRPELATIREEFFGPKLPASTLITTPALAHPDYLIEIEAIAFVEGR
jgi:enamine deaminase RidA (YjgF/YER057c/UK114 family)